MNEFNLVRRLRVPAFFLLCAALVAVVVEAFVARTRLSVETPNMWSISLSAWIVCDVCVAVLVALIVSLKWGLCAATALGSIGGIAVLLVATSIAGRYTGAATVGSLFGASVVAATVVRWLNQRQRGSTARYGLRVACIATGIAAVSVATSALAYHAFEDPSWAYGRSPNGEWSMTYVTGGSPSYFPSVVVSRAVLGGLLREDRVVSITGKPRPSAHWVNDRVVVVDGHSQNIFTHLDLSPPA